MQKRNHLSYDLVETSSQTYVTKINHYGNLISLGDYSNKSSIGSLVNDPTIMEFQENLHQILRDGVLKILVES